MFLIFHCFYWSPINSQNFRLLHIPNSKKCLLNINDLQTIHISLLVQYSNLNENKEVLCHGPAQNLITCETTWELIIIQKCTFFWYSDSQHGISGLLGVPEIVIIAFELFSVFQKLNINHIFIYNKAKCQNGRNCTTQYGNTGYHILIQKSDWLIHRFD